MTVEATAQLLHELVVDNSEIVAIRHWDGVQETCLSYGRLQELAQKVGESVQKMKLQRNAVVAVYMETNPVVLAIILGIMRSSASFLYLSPEESVEFTDSLLKRTGASGLISDHPLNFSDYELSDELPEGLYFHKSRQPYDIGTNLPPLAYVMFTSGTTGPLKIVRVPHSCILPNILDFKKLYDITSDDRIFLSSPLTFDPSVIDIFLALSTGACLIMVADKIKGNAAQLAEVLFEKYTVTVLQTTPTVFSSFDDEIISNKILGCHSHVRVLALGGERFPTDIFRKLARSTSVKPAVYNLYGITEVSCWATYHKLDLEKDLSDAGVPLGLPMSGTRLRVEVVQSELRDSGYSVLYIGGTGRVCFLDGEAPTGEVYRRTGDVVIQEADGSLFFVGRTDDQAKRLGKKINVEHISAVLAGHERVHQAVVTFVGSLLAAFVVLRTESDDTAYRILDSVKAYARRQLARHCWPDVWQLQTSIPMTKHGKIDKRRLHLLANALINLPPFERKFIKLAVNSICQAIIGVCMDESRSEELFSSLGLDSLKALQVTQMLQNWSQLQLGDVFDILLRRKLKDLWLYLETECFSLMLAGSTPSTDTELLTKKLKREESFSSSYGRDTLLYPLFTGTVLMKANRARCGNAVVDLCWTSVPSTVTSSPHAPLRLKIQPAWRWDSGKCIDASPLLVMDKENSHARIFIGSHSGRFASLDAYDGSCLWVQALPDRIEASAILSVCGRYVIIGCYDGSMYFLSSETGKMFWKYQTSDAIKTSAVHSSVVGLVYIGSYDRRLYLLDVEERACVCTVLLDGAIYSTPIVCCRRSMCFVATFGGSVYALREVCLTICWRRRFSKPFFSSLAVHEETLFAACTDQIMYLLNLDSGDTIRKLALDGPVFSTPTIFSAASSAGTVAGLVVGCHDKKIYCLLEDGTRKYCVDLRSEVAASPFIFELSHSPRQFAVCIATVVGILYVLDAEDGKILASLQLPGELFSSPVVWNNRIFVGCRDNGLHCLQQVYESFDIAENGCDAGER